MTQPASTEAGNLRDGKQDHLSPLHADSRKRLRAYVESILGWIGATQVALNAGGIVTSVSIIQSLNNPLLIISGFFFGLLLTLTSAILIVFASIDHLFLLEKIDRNDLDDLNKSTVERHVKIAFCSAIAGIASLLVFLGSAAAVVSNYRNDTDNDRRCIAIQHDMLSSTPQRSDSPDLFQALGCRPKGGGSVYAKRKSKAELAVPHHNR